MRCLQLRYDLDLTYAHCHILCGSSKMWKINDNSLGNTITTTITTRYLVTVSHYKLLCQCCCLSSDR